MARATGAEVSLLPLRVEDGWALDLDALQKLLRPTTRAIVVNAPHNPAGMLPDRDTWARLQALAAEAGARLVADEIYRFLEVDPRDRLPAAADGAATAISLGGMSKSFGMAGVRIGWLATRDRGVLDRIACFKDYTTICNSAPSEILALIALRARESVLARGAGICAANLAHLDRFFATWADRFAWVRPRGGSVGFPRLLADVPIERFAADLVEQEGVLLLPGTLFDHSGNHFRIGFGRASLPEALARLEAFAARVL